MPFASPVSTLYTGLAAVVSFCVEHHMLGLRRSKLNLSYRAAMKGGEWYRFGTSTLLYNLTGLGDLWTLVVLYVSLAALEKRLFRGNPVGFLMAMALGIAAVLLPGYYIKDLRFKEPAGFVALAMITWSTVAGLAGGWISTAGLEGKLPLLAVAMSLVRPHVSAVDMPLAKKQLLSVGAGLMLVLLFPDPDAAAKRQAQRQEVARRREEEAAVAARKDD